MIIQKWLTLLSHPVNGHESCCKIGNIHVKTMLNGEKMIWARLLLTTYERIALSPTAL